MTFRIVFALIACLFMHSVSAEFIRDGEVYIGVAEYIHDSDRELEEGLSFEAGFERPINNDLSWDFWFSRYDANGTTAGSDSRVKRLSQGLLYHLNEGNTRAFVNGGLGHQKFDPTGSEKIKETALHLGMGVKFYQKSSYIFRAEMLALHSADHEVTDLGTRLTLGYAFGREFVREKPEPEPIPEPEPEPIPEPEPEPEPEPVPEPSDEDADGVFDDTDLCPGTDPAYRVDETGCAIVLTEQISLEMDVKFAADSAKLTIDYYPEVKKIADVMKQAQNTRLTVEGHTDYQGSRQYNQRLSQQRAESIRQVLIVEFGLSEDRVAAIGYGEEQPIADNTTKEGRAINRRVVAIIEAQLTKNALR
jgi:OmpA-OmpF porin, OOP family